jgi:uncharacterized protein
MNPKYSPIKSSESIILIDVLRGFAIFGILMVNLPLMYEPISRMMLGAKADSSVVNIVAESFIKFFFEGKFYVIFSMLFGFGFWIFMNKTTDDGSSITPVYSRRLFFLLLFGAAHAILLWAGDILIFYALLGFILMLFRKSSDKKIFKWAVVLTLIPTILSSFFVILIWLVSQSPEIKSTIDTEMQRGVAELQQLVTNVSKIYATGTYSETIIARLKEYEALLPAVLFFYPVVLGMFLIGILAARRGLIANYEEHLPFFRKLLWWGLGIGIIASTIYTIAFRHTIASIPNVWSLLTSSMHAFSGVSLALCYVSGIVILFASGKAERLKMYLAPVGKMALTNYLSHSIICIFLFYSFGLGLFGKVEVWKGIILTIVIFSLQIIFSRWWLRHFYFGPFEWLWRTLTYLKVQPFRRMQ